jgi:flagellar hook assembly protein FlgD
VGYAESVEVPQEIDSSRYTFSLDQNFPNPFLAAGGETTINFSLPSDSHVRLAVYDLSGRLITTLVDDTLTAGRHTLGWDGTTSRGTGVESGVYFYKIDTDNNSATRRLVLVR